MNINSLRENLKTTITTIVITITAATIGFYINDYQIRERLAIEHVGLRPSISEIAISTEVRKLVSELKELNTFTMFSIISGDLKVFDDDQVKTYLENIQNQKSKYEKFLKEYSSDLSIVTTLIGQESFNSKSFYKLSSTYFDSYVKGSKENLTKIQVSINKKIKNAEILVNKLDKIISQVIADVYKAKSNSSFQIDVILVNNGKSQSLLRNSGEIAFGEDIIYLKKKKRKYSRFDLSSHVLDNFIIIKETSFNSMTLVIDEYNNRKRMLDLAKREYISGSRKAILRLYDSAGNAVLTSELLFRNDLEEERKVSLLDFIDQNYNKYINKDL